MMGSLTLANNNKLARRNKLYKLIYYPIDTINNKLLQMQ